MILTDYSQLCISSFFANGVIKQSRKGGKSSTSSPDVALMRHVILNTLRSYVQKFSDTYGQLVICADGKNSWRKQVFPFYKVSRAKAREDSGVDWKLIFDTMTGVFKEIQELHLYPCIRVNSCEADDVISVLCEISFRASEKTLIISSDHDFVQLQKYQGISQYSPTSNSFIKEVNPSDYLIEHIIIGDHGDNIPNIFSDDDCFVTEGKRQSPATKKKIDQVMAYVYSSSSVNINEEWKRNFDRNKILIDLDNTPKELCDEIKKAYDSEISHSPDKKGFFDYLVTHRCKLLIECIDEFFCKPVNYNNLLEVF